MSATERDSLSVLIDADDIAATRRRPLWSLIVATGAGHCSRIKLQGSNESKPYSEPFNYFIPQKLSAEEERGQQKKKKVKQA